MYEYVIQVRQPDRKPLRVVVVGQLEVGRECDGLLLADERASRRHASLMASAGGLAVVDLGSTNGTLVNGTPALGPTPVSPGDMILIGDTVIEPVGRFGEAGAERGVGGGPPTHDRTRAGRDTVIERVASGEPPADSELQRLRQLDSTVTVAFTDIERSTELAEQLGDTEWMEVLRTHDGAVRAATKRFGGIEVKHQGDGFMLAFSSARRAVLAAVAMQQRTSQLFHHVGVRIRIGLHTGEAIAEDGDLFGRHVIVAARIASLAAGSEILASSIVTQLTAGDSRIRYGPAREVTLKGLTGRHVLHTVAWEPLPG